MFKEMLDKDKAIKLVQKKVVGLKSSPLFAYRIENNYHPVVGEGSIEAQVMFIGEAPGKNEAKTGQPFCGAAGKILDELLQSVDLNSEDVYITNIVKDRPPENRDPTKEEIKVYGPLLDREIEIIKPKVIATLGRYSMNYILEKFGLGDLGTIGELHGKSFEAKASYGPITIIPLYHPAATIYNQRLKPALLEDFKVLRKFMLE